MQLQENWFLGKEGCPDDDDVKLGECSAKMDQVSLPVFTLSTLIADLNLGSGPCIQF
jgi:hypothetical protein